MYHCDEVRLGLLLGDTGIALNCDCATVGTNVWLLCGAATGQVGWGFLGETKGGADGSALDCDCNYAGTDIGLLCQRNEAWLRLFLGDTGIALNCDCATVGANIGLLCATMTGTAETLAEILESHSTAIVRQSERILGYFDGVRLGLSRRSLGRSGRTRLR